MQLKRNRRRICDVAFFSVIAALILVFGWGPIVFSAAFALVTYLAATDRVFTATALFVGIWLSMLVLDVPTPFELIAR